MVSGTKWELFILVSLGLTTDIQDTCHNSSLSILQIGTLEVSSKEWKLWTTQWSLISWELKSRSFLWRKKKLKKILLLSAPDCRCSLSVSHKSNIMKQSLCTHIFFFPFSFFSFLNQLNPHLKIRRTYIKLTFLAFSWKSVSLVVQMVKKKKKKTACNAGGPEFDPWVAKIPWRRKWQLTRVFLSGELYGQRSLAGYSLWSYKELDMTERAHILTALKTNYTPFLHF